MDQKSVEKAKSEVTQSLTDKFATKGDMSTQIKKSQKKLPRSVAKDAKFIEQAEEQLKHPKLRKLVDQNKVNAAKKRIIRKTKAVEIEEKDYKGAFVSWFGGLLFNLLIAAFLIFGAAYWMGAFNGLGE